MEPLASHATGSLLGRLGPSLLLGLYLYWSIEIMHSLNLYDKHKQNVVKDYWGIKVI